MSIGKRIKQRRMEMGISQRDLADRMGYSNHSTIARIEAGKVDIPQSKIVQFAEVLETSIAYLMNWETENDNKNDRSKQTVGDVIREMRISRNLTVHEFAEEIGIPEELIKKYENGYEQVPFYLMQIIASYFGIPFKNIPITASYYDDEFFNKQRLKHMTKWIQEIGNVDLSEEEMDKIIEFTKFVLAQRDKS